MISDDDKERVLKTPADQRDAIREHLSAMEDRVLGTFQDLMDREVVDQRWLSIARTHIEQGFMAAKRGLYEGKRVGD